MKKLQVVEVKGKRFYVFKDRFLGTLLFLLSIFITAVATAGATSLWKDYYDFLRLQKAGGGDCFVEKRVRPDEYGATYIKPTFNLRERHLILLYLDDGVLRVYKNATDAQWDTRFRAIPPRQAGNFVRPL